MFRKSLAGIDFFRLMDEIEKSGIVAIERCENYTESQGLVIRFQQRKTVCDLLRKYVRQHQEDKEWLMSELNREEGNEYTPDDTHSA